MSDKREYLGTGWGFPVTFDKRTGVAMTEGDEDIRQSLHLLFSTLPGERVFRFTYGCDLTPWVFSRMTLTDQTELTRVIQKAVLDWEPRILVEKVTIDMKEEMEGTVWIGLEYRVRRTNSRSNMVYPFYLSEGTNL